MWLDVIEGIVLALATVMVLSAAALVAFPVRLEVFGELRDLHLRTRVDMRLAFGALILRRLWSGELEIRVLGLLLWRFGPQGEGLLREIWRRLLDTETRGRWSRRGERLLAQLRAALPHWRPLLAVGVKLLRTASVRAEVAGTVGFDDPADTVVFFEVFRHIAPRGPRLVVALSRDYFDEVLELDAHLRMRLWPLRMAAVGVAALATRQVRRALLDVHQARAEAG